jgi:hypothetical protein
MGCLCSSCCRRAAAPDDIALQLRKGRTGDNHSLLSRAVVHNPEVEFQLSAAPTPLLKDVDFAPTLDSDPDDGPSSGEDAKIERMLAESHSSDSNEMK